MAQTQRSRLEAVFLAASELPRAEQEHFLKRECASDPELIPLIREMLAAERVTDKQGAWSGPAWAGLRFGSYRVTASLGSGGMGVVYAAVRDDDEFHKRVAIKTIPRGLLTDLGAQRLRLERQILAELEHPNIARLLDGGTTEEGVPYVVMEYVDGQPITAYADSHKLNTHERLRLFRQVCAGVQFAHSNLVVHRDLKPANVLVGEDGIPKLLDFGIAKLLDESAERTRTGASAMTPEYASPEQIRGAPITTASDVFSLGLLLYELLTGRRPYRNTANAIGLAQAIATQEPEALSVRDGRRFDADLENIVQMALRKEPERRYASVEQFSEDIRRYLEGFTVAARPDTPGYRAKKFIARHRVGVAAAGVVLAVVATLALGMFAEWREARRRFAEVRAVSDSLIFDIYDSVRDLPGSMPARQRVAGIAREYLDRLASSGNPDDALRAELATAYRKLGDIQGEPYVSSLGDTAGALENYRKAQRLLEGARHPGGEELATVYQQIGRVLVRQGHPEEGRRIQLKAVPIFEQLRRGHPNDSATGQRLALAYIFLGQTELASAGAHHDIEATRMALKDYLRASEAARSALAQAPNDALALMRVALAEYHQCNADWVLGKLIGDRSYFEQAAEHSIRAVEFAERARQADPSHLATQFRLSDAYLEHAQSLELLGRRQEALAFDERSYAILVSLADREVNNRELTRALANCESRLMADLAKSDWPEAQNYYWSALARFDKLRRDDAKNMEAVYETVSLKEDMAQVFIARGNRAAAAALYRENLDLLRRTDGSGEITQKELGLLKATAR